MAVSPDGQSIVTADNYQGRTASLFVYDVQSGGQKGEASARGILSVAFVGPDHILGSDRSKRLRLWRIADGKIVEEDVPPHLGQADWVASASDGRMLALANGNAVTLYAESRDPTTAITLPHDAPIRSLAFDRDGTRLLTGTTQGSVYVWNCRERSPQPLRRFEHGSFVTSVASHGNFVVTAGGSMAKVWDLARNDSTPTVSFASSARVWSAAVDPAGDVLSVLSSDGLLRMWSRWTTATPKEVVTIRLGAAPDRDALQLAFASGGRFLVSRRETGLKAWLWRPADLIAAACDHLANNIDETRRRTVCAAP